MASAAPLLRHALEICRFAAGHLVQQHRRQVATQRPEWKTEMEQNFWSDEFVPGDQFRRNIAQEYATIKALFTDLGLAKQ